MLCERLDDVVPDTTLLSAFLKEMMSHAQYVRSRFDHYTRGLYFGKEYETSELVRRACAHPFPISDMDMIRCARLRPVPSLSGLKNQSRHQHHKGPGMAFTRDCGTHSNDVNSQACTFLVRPVAVGMPIGKKKQGATNGALPAVQTDH